MTKIFVAGHTGMVGSAIFRQLSSKGANIIVATREECNLLSQRQVRNFFKKHKFDQVYLAAAKVGGIYANNTYPADFIYENLMIQNNVIHSAYESDVQKLLFLGSSCIYPKLATQPMAEESLMTGPLESTNEPYAIAKIAGIKTCESYNRQYGTDFRCVMPTNLYGPGDNYHKENSHVMPALIRRFCEAVKEGKNEVKIWGTGNPRREFLYVDDLAKACLFVMQLKHDEYSQITEPQRLHVNVGSGADISISDLAFLVSECVNYRGQLIFDNTMPDGAPQKLMDSSKIYKMGWAPCITLPEGISKTVQAFKYQKCREY